MEIKTYRLKGPCRRQNNYNRLKIKQKLWDLSLLFTSSVQQLTYCVTCLNARDEINLSHANHTKRKGQVTWVEFLSK